MGFLTLKYKKLNEKTKQCLSYFFFFFYCVHRDLDCLGVKNRAGVALPVEEVLQTLNDLIAYFQLPDAELEHEERQIKLRSLKNRQNLFKQEVSFSLKYKKGLPDTSKYKDVVKDGGMC